MPASCLLKVSVVALSCAMLAQPALAQPAAPSSPSDRAARRFPQLVRVGDLIGRQVLAAKEQQPVLGRVSGIVRRPDGHADVVIAVARWFGIGARPVAVPIEAVALLGEYVALLDVTPEQLSETTTFEPASAVEVPADDAIRVGLVKPFH